MFFKSVDEKLKEIGFEKIKEDKYGCSYCRHDKYYNFDQIVDILYKTHNDTFILQSYDKDLFEQKKFSNTCVELTFNEIKLFYKKMKELRRKYGTYHSVWCLY